MSPELKGWLNKVVYPRLTHDQVFGGLPNFTKAEFSETRYADCPRCHRHGTFYMLPDRHVGQCSSCSITIAWFGFLKFDQSEAEAIERIASLAGVERPSHPAKPQPPKDDFVVFRD